MAEYGSDLIVDLLKALDIEYVALNPGASFRGLHDSIVNYGGNKNPEIILCCHEAIAVSVAHGYCKAAMRPMAAAVHDIVGLLNSTMSVFVAWLDQSPVLVLGGTGPMAHEMRRPYRDWIHTALVQGNAVRDYVKLDDQPTSLSSLPGSLLRAYRVAMTEPKAPVYVCLDAELQETRLEQQIAVHSVNDYAPPSQPQADPSALAKAAELLVNAERPVIIADYLGRNQQAVKSLVELAEILALPVIDFGSRGNFPNNHPLDLTDAEGELIREADVILALDMGDLETALTELDSATRKVVTVTPEYTKVIHITLGDIALKSWCQHIGKLRAVHVPILADTSLALPSLIKQCRQLIKEESREKYKQRFAALKARHDSLREEWIEKAKRTKEEKPISAPLLAIELWDQIKDEDWVLVGTPHTMLNWTRRLWDGLTPSRWIGAHGGGGAIGYGVGHCFGAALAYGKLGRLCIDLQPDGDLLYTPSALWTLAHHPVPLLVVMFNNRSYYNSELHQERMARLRGRSLDNKHIGTRLENPTVDYAALSRSFGLYAEGPIEDPHLVGPAFKRAVEYVKEKRAGALIDIITQPR
ncbi:thiamine pyrophosphate-binding protein [Thermodesulfobacteriota bacterium]